MWKIHCSSSHSLLWTGAVYWRQWPWSSGLIFFFFGVVLGFWLFFFNFPLLYSVLTPVTLENDKIVHRGAGAPSVFPSFSAQCTDDNGHGRRQNCTQESGVGPSFPLRYFRKYRRGQGCMGHCPIILIFFLEGQLARRAGAPAAFNADAPLWRRVRCLDAVKN